MKIECAKASHISIGWVWGRKCATYTHRKILRKVEGEKQKIWLWFTDDGCAGADASAAVACLEHKCMCVSTTAAHSSDIEPF